MDKMTNVKALNYVLTNCTNIPADVREKLEKMMAQTAKHNTSKKSKGASLMDGVGAKVLAEMAHGVAYELSDFANMPCFAEHPKTKTAYTPNQIAPVLTGLVNAGQVVKAKVKGKMTYTLSDEDGVDDPDFQATDYELNTMF